MDFKELSKGASDVAALSLKEYGVSLNQLLAQEDDERRFRQLSRLIGIFLKEPFAEPVNLDSPSADTGSLRAWHLVPDEKSFSEPSRLITWQYKTLEELIANGDAVEEIGWVPPSAYELARNAQHERGFFGYLSISMRKYLCRDAKLREKIEKNIQEAKTSGFNLKVVTPEIIVSSAGLSLGAFLVQSVPILAFVGAPVIAGLVLVIYSIGLDAFCSWAASREHELDVVER
jgi:hypothetical protein